MISYRNDEGRAAIRPRAFYAFGLTEWRDLESAVEYALDQGGCVRSCLLPSPWAVPSTGQFLRRSPLASRVSALVLDAAGPGLPPGSSPPRSTAKAFPLQASSPAAGSWSSGPARGSIWP